MKNSADASIVERLGGGIFFCWGVWLLLFPIHYEFTTGLYETHIPISAWGILLTTTGAGKFAAAWKQDHRWRRRMAMIAFVVWLSLEGAAWRHGGFRLPSVALLPWWAWAEAAVYSRACGARQEEKRNAPAAAVPA